MIFRPLSDSHLRAQRICRACLSAHLRELLLCAVVIEVQREVQLALPREEEALVLAA